MDDKEIGVQFNQTLSRNNKQNKKRNAISVHGSKVHLPHMLKSLHRLVITIIIMKKTLPVPVAARWKKSRGKIYFNYPSKSWL